MKNEMNKNNGITLIALVITIIILLILAGIAIASLTGDNGLFARARQAREETLTAQEDELRNLTILEAATHLEEYEFEDESGKKVTIPAQCAVSQVEGENILADGLVIIDANGNEWVWVEVPESVTESATTDEEIGNALRRYTSEYSYYSDTWYDGCGLEEQEYADRYSEMLQSIKANNGFFVGRYETGSFDNPVTSTDITRKAVIQKGTYPYNFVTCSQAQELSEELGIGSKTSSLMFGIQWNLVLKYLELNGDWDTNEHEAIYYLHNDSSSWGNTRNAKFSVSEGNKYGIKNNDGSIEWKDVPEDYIKQAFDSNGNGIMLSTGATKRNSKMNIYDLSGNMSEWTLEKSNVTDAWCTPVSGAYTGTRQADYRGYRVPGVSFGTVGFRATLY